MKNKQKDIMSPVFFEKESSSKTGNLVDSGTAKLNDILYEKFEDAYNKQTSKVSTHDIAKIAVDHTPIDLAVAASHLSPHARPVLFDNLPDQEAKIEFLINTDKETRLLVLRFMKDLEIKNLIEKISADQAIKILEDLSERRYRRVMELIAPKKTARIMELEKHDKNSASRLMTSAFFAFFPEMTVGEAASYIRDYPRIDFSKGIFVLNEDKKLIGYVPGRNLVINDKSLTLKQVMRPIKHKVTPDTPREEVVDIVEKYKVPFLPVVDENEHIRGVISYENVVEAMEDLADETMAKIAGTAEDVGADESLLKKIFARSPWLIVTIFAGLVNFGIMSFFEKYEGAFLTFALFFVPLITGMSGNIGIQCSTVLVRGMAIGLLSAKTKAETVTKELSIGFLSGIIFGVVVGVFVYFIDLFLHVGVSPIAIGVIVGVGLSGACFVGTILGVFSPLFFARIGIDPAIASGPIVTAFNDVLSMTIYFVIAWGLSFLFF